MNVRFENSLSPLCRPSLVPHALVGAVTNETSALNGRLSDLIRTPSRTLRNHSLTEAQ